MRLASLSATTNYQLLSSKVTNPIRMSNPNQTSTDLKLRIITWISLSAHSSVSLSLSGPPSTSISSPLNYSLLYMRIENDA